MKDGQPRIKEAVKMMETNKRVVVVDSDPFRPNSLAHHVSETDGRGRQRCGIYKVDQ